MTYFLKLSDAYKGNIRFSMGGKFIRQRYLPDKDWFKTLEYILSSIVVSCAATKGTDITRLLLIRFKSPKFPYIQQASQEYEYVYKGDIDIHPSYFDIFEVYKYLFTEKDFYPVSNGMYDSYHLVKPIADQLKIYLLDNQERNVHNDIYLHFTCNVNVHSIAHQGLYSKANVKAHNLEVLDNPYQ